MESKATLWENSEEIFRIAGRHGVQDVRVLGSIVCWWSIWGQYPGAWWTLLSPMLYDNHPARASYRRPFRYEGRSRVSRSHSRMSVVD